ncbi:hypothetical protein BGZ83_008526 [Gryganskiella cystojenkinii]|nr:hypothetical protein BGZ83_008526 [Gryganskiella cystojenkinii]
MTLTLFCIVDGESTPFSVDIDASKTVDHLKETIKTKKTNDFSNVDADKLTLWRVSIPVLPKKERKQISLADVSSKEELDETDDISDVFEESPLKKTIHVLVQRTLPCPSGDLHPEMAALRKQLSDMEQLNAKLSSTFI